MIPKTIIEPFRIHSVEPLRMTTESERPARMQAPATTSSRCAPRDVLIDLLTDSGTGAMSSEQWAGIQRGDESYAGSPSWFRFEAAVKELFPFRHVIPTHQGRAAEKILITVLGGPGRVVPNNTHFDTTRANVEATGAEAIDLVIPDGLDPAARAPVQGQHGPGRPRGLPARAWRRRPGRLRHDHEQLRRRPAGVAGEPARRARDLRPLRGPAVPRRLPLRRERLVHPRARGGAGRTGTSPTSCATSRRWRTG
jgi:hypothetical protein